MAIIVPTLRMSKSPYMVLDTVIFFITFVINSRNWLLLSQLLPMIYLKMVSYRFKLTKEA